MPKPLPSPHGAAHDQASPVALRLDDLTRQALLSGIGGVGLWAADVDSKVEIWDEQCCKIFGDPAPAGERPIDAWLHRLHPDDRNRVQAQTSTARRDAKSGELEYRIFWPDGTVRHVQTRYMPILGPTGRTVRWVGTNLDVTGLRDAQLAAQSTSERLALALDVARIGVIELGPDDELTYADGPAYELLGLQPTALPMSAADWQRHVQPQDLPALIAACATVRDASLLSPLELGLEYRISGDAGTAVRHVLSRLRAHRDDFQRPGSIGVLFDVTALRRAEHEARESAALLRLTTEGAGVGFWRLTLGEDHVALDQQARRLLGLDIDAPITFSVWSSAIFPDDREDVRVRLQRALQRGGAFDMEYRVLGPEGHVRHVADRGIVRLDASGRAASVTGILWDLTPRRDAEAAARNATERLQIASRSTGFAVWDWDIASGRMIWDERMQGLIGAGIGAGTGAAQQHGAISQLRALVHVEDRARVDEALTRALEGAAPLDLEFRILRTDGATRWLAARGHVERDASGRAHRMLGVNWDVTDRRSAELQARESAERLHLATTAAGLGIWDRDLVIDRIVWDEGMYRLFGRPGDLTPAQCFSQSVHAEDRAREHAARATAIATGSVYQTEFRIVRPDGEIRWIAARGVVHRAADGTPLRMVGVDWDVTESRRTEEAERARETAERSNRAKSEFLSRMSHELRTPLNAILGFAQLLELDTDEPLTLGQRERVGRIHTAGWHLMRLIGDVLDLSRIEAGAAAISMEIVNVQPLLRDAIAMMQPEVEQRGLRLSSQVASDASAHVWADGTRLKQVVLNVLSNAIRYNRPRGAVAINVEARGGDQVVIAVRDSGRGLSRVQLAQMFQPFNRLGLESVEPDGTGIGLAISQRLVEQMRGVIEVDSEVGSGTEFRIVLNAARVAPRADAPALAEFGRVRMPLQTRDDISGCVLYVEDNPANSALVEQLMHFRPGITLYKAQDGATGQVLASACRPALVLIDMRLPDMDGLRLLRLLRQQAETQAVPCVALSANAMAEDIRLALAAGFNEYWTKPLDALHFLAGIDRYFTAGVTTGVASAMAENSRAPSQPMSSLADPQATGK